MGPLRGCHFASWTSKFSFEKKIGHSSTIPIFKDIEQFPQPKEKWMSSNVRLVSPLQYHLQYHLKSAIWLLLLQLEILANLAVLSIMHFVGLEVSCPVA